MCLTDNLILNHLSNLNVMQALFACSLEGLLHEAAKPRKRGKKLDGRVLGAFCERLNNSPTYQVELNYEDLAADYKIAPLLIDFLDELHDDDDY